MLIITLVAAAIPQGRALACGCTDLGAAGNFMVYEFVFTGQANDPPEITERQGATLHRYTLAVKDVWKGSLGPSVIVESVVACGMTFEPGAEYLVYASSSGPGVITAEPCSSSSVAYASDDLAFLNGAPIVGVVLLVAGIVLIALRMRRRKLSPPAP